MNNSAYLEKAQGFIEDALSCLDFDPVEIDDVIENLRNAIRLLEIYEDDVIEDD